MLHVLLVAFYRTNHKNGEQCRWHASPATSIHAWNRDFLAKKHVCNLRLVPMRMRKIGASVQAIAPNSPRNAAAQASSHQAVSTSFEGLLLLYDVGWVYGERGHPRFGFRFAFLLCLGRAKAPGPAKSSGIVWFRRTMARSIRAWLPDASFLWRFLCPWSELRNGCMQDRDRGCGRM